MPDSTLPAAIDAQTSVAILIVADQAAIRDYALAEVPHYALSPSP